MNQKYDIIIILDYLIYKRYRKLSGNLVIDSSTLMKIKYDNWTHTLYNSKYYGCYEAGIKLQWMNDDIYATGIE